ncbi:MAG: hypothetical protein ACOZCL_17690 [Bacillota bacterium]
MKALLKKLFGISKKEVKEIEIENVEDIYAACISAKGEFKEFCRLEIK